ncbi:MAG: cation-translocating P-type ATPase, partial [Deltaproteobacteria bacterium]
MSVEIPRFWEQSVPELLAKLGSRASGLSSDEAHRRLKTYGKNTVHRAKRIPSLILLLSQFKSPIILILLAVSLVSLFLGDPANSLIIIVIVLISSLLGFWQEKGASDIVQRLLSIVHVKANMLRDGREVQVPIEDSVPGDITILSAGDSIPGDCLIIESEDLSVDESVLTGESVPVDKRAGTVEGSAPFSRRSNSLFMGTHVVNGTARALVVNTDRRTEFGRIASRLGRRKPPTDFELGIKRFGWFIMALSMVMVAAIFLINLAFRKPLIESLLFSLSLAVGLTPQLLPAIITVNLAKGAKRMAGLKVVVKRLDSIENLGSMNILCSDKTGTLTEGVMKARSFLDPSGRHCETVFFHAYLTAMLKKGFRNPIDKAIREYRHADITGYSKRGEVQYDFERKRMSMLVEKNGEAFIVAKGAFSSIIGICDRAEKEPGQRLPLADNRTTIERTFDSLGEQGFRVLGVAYRPAAQDAKLTKEEEKGMIFLGFVVLADPPKAGIREVIRRLESTGVRLKILTGDNKEVAHYICHAAFGLEGDVKTGEEISDLPEKEFARALEETEIFAEIDPLLKERIIRAFRDAGNVVGFLGDGINDTPALHACDASITVNSAVDIAKETSDIVLLEKDLGVLTDGIYEGRKTFADTLK